MVYIIDTGNAFDGNCEQLASSCVEHVGGSLFFEEHLIIIIIIYFSADSDGASH